MKIFVVTKKNLILLVALLAIAAAAVWGVSRGIAVTTASEKKRLPIYSVETAQKEVCLTFDAAWGNEDTAQLISILDEYNAKATFFVVGEWVDKYPDSVLAFHNAGHAIENHSNTHADMTKLDYNGVVKEIQDCNQKIEDLIGKRPTLFRAPSGSYDNRTVETTQELGMYCIQWDVDSLDWKKLSTQEITSRVLNQVQDGSIILFHNGLENTPLALPTILDELVSRGYTFVTVDELIIKENFSVDNNGRQHSINT